MFPHDPLTWLKDLLVNAGLGYRFASTLGILGIILFILTASWLANLIARTIISTVVTRIVRRTVSVWDDIFLEQKVFTRLSHFAPAVVIWIIATWSLKGYPVWLLVVHRLTYIYMLVVGAVVINSFIEAWYRIYLTLPISEHRSIKGYVQIVKLIVVLIFGLIIVSVIFSREVTTIIAGLGVMASVIMLIFKDAILGLVASIQLSANKMVKIGDWITIPSREVDGEVTDITLMTVKVRNFDKTIITVPVYALVIESFQNWSGMQESGVRQIKRNFLIDVNSIAYPDGKLKSKIEAIPLLKDYYERSSPEGQTFIKEKNKKLTQYFSTGSISNLGWFRMYAEAYLKSHPGIDPGQTVIVRHRQPTEHGMPLQVYAFTSKTEFITYENVQSEIFEHLLVIAGEFGLRIFQEPSGYDIGRPQTN